MTNYISNFCLNLFIILIIFTYFETGIAINCFTCSSRNLTDIPCHDPFHPAKSIYTPHCKVGKKNHIGQFPANFCIKVKGKSLTTKEELVIRTCSIENMDNQCGTFKFDNETMHGCIVTCSIDGCNHATGRCFYDYVFMITIAINLMRLKKVNIVL